MYACEEWTFIKTGHELATGFIYWPRGGVYGAMTTHMTRRDMAGIAAGFVLVLLVSAVAQTTGVGPMIELPLDVLTAVVILIGVYYIYRAVDLSGGVIGRYLTLLAIGMAYYALTFIPHVQLHIFGFGGIGPVDPMAVFGFQHGMTIGVFVLAMYAFYLFAEGDLA